MRDQEAQASLSRARAAQALWGRLLPKERVQALRPLRHVMAQRIDEIVRILSEEVGKPCMDALAGDFMVTIEILRYYEGQSARALRAKRRGKPWPFFLGTSFVEFREPHGVVLVHAPWNYPLQLSMVPMATALFAGNAVLLKCSEHTPRTARLIEELCAAAGLPKNLVQVSCEVPEEAVALLKARPDFIFFTGSTRNGRAVATIAAELMIPTMMELGGKDAALVFDTCDLERTANGVAYGSFSNTGQTCVSIKRLYVQKGIYDRFLRVLLEKVDGLRVGTSVESDLGPVFGVARQRLREQVEDALARGAISHTAWKIDSDAIVPVVLTDVPDDAALVLEESFGPVLCIWPFEGEEDAIRLANASEFALSASVWTGNKAQADHMAARLQCGSCGVNDLIRNIGNPHAAFGGNKSSGHGRYHGIEGLAAFSRVKTVMRTDSPRQLEIHWFPFRTRTFSQVRALLKLRHSKNLVDRVSSLRGLWRG
jgi:acyl-CoA reductase-like NAD-dependent aldehyde dehydrogenase